MSKAISKEGSNLYLYFLIPVHEKITVTKRNTDSKLLVCDFSTNKNLNYIRTEFALKVARDNYFHELFKVRGFVWTFCLETLKSWTFVLFLLRERSSYFAGLTERVSQFPSCTGNDARPVVFQEPLIGVPQPL